VKTQPLRACFWRSRPLETIPPFRVENLSPPPGCGPLVSRRTVGCGGGVSIKRRAAACLAIGPKSHLVATEDFPPLIEQEDALIASIETDGVFGEIQDPAKRIG
jgi:hypothetical protein